MTVIKVQIDFDDGTYNILRGEDARRWQEACDIATTVAHFHHLNPFDKLTLNWERGTWGVPGKER